MTDDHPSTGSPKKTWLDKLSQLFQGEPKDRNDLVEVIADAEERDLIDQDTKDMIEGVLEIAELRVRDIMIPRSQMVTIEKSQPVDEFLPVIIESGHSRFPVINEDKDHVEGILLAKDLLPFGFGGQHASEPLQLEKILRPTVIVPESKRVDRLLKEFREERYHMAIVVDEFGGVSGLVTIEDILELIVGEIDDEFDDIEDEPEEIRRNVAQHQELATLARDGYDLLLRLRNLNGLRRGDSGRYIAPADLTKLERAQLANVFDVVRMVQDAVRSDFHIPSRL